jgi:hypothetical protein
VWICAGLLLLTAQAGQARVEDTCEYSKSQVFRSALRFLRVDQGYTISERDEESGYLLFDYPLDKSATTPGSLEIIERDDRVKLVVTIAKMPEYHERLFVSKFLEKLRADYGELPRTKKKEKPAPDSEKDEERDEERDNLGEKRENSKEKSPRNQPSP